MTNPLISSDELRMLMSGRKMVKLYSLKSHINKKTNDVDDDWVTVGIVVGKDTKVSKNGNEYSLWKLSDLKSEKHVSLFLFGKSNEKHWKLPIGAVIGLLNATIMSDNKDYKGKAAEMCSLTLDDPEKLLHIGTSKDMGYCKAVKKNGQVCGTLITKAEDEYCLYHIKNAYRKFSAKRPELQTTFSDKEPDQYYFGNNYTPNVGLNEKNIVLELKSVNKKQMTSKKEAESKMLQKAIANPLSIAARNLSQLAAIQKSPKGAPSSVSSRLPTNLPVSFAEFFNNVKDQLESNSQNSTASSQLKKDLPVLAKGLKRGHSISFDIGSVSEAQMSAAKRRAIEILKNKPIATVPKPNIVSPSTCTKSTNSSTTTNIKITPPSSSSSSGKSKKLADILKRVNQTFSQSNDELANEQAAAEKAKAQLIEAALKRTSVNQKMVEQVENELEGRYFNTLEKKERLEARMIDAREMKVKVVTCSACKYTAPSQSDLCKSKGHEVSFHQATKRFFICKNCKTRAATLDKFMPTKACTGCGGTNFDKAGMMKVRCDLPFTRHLQLTPYTATFFRTK